MSKVLKKAEGLIIKRSKLNEKDALVHLLCTSGELLPFRLHGIYASNKRSRLDTDICNFIQLDYYDYEEIKLANAKEITAHPQFIDIKNDYGNLLFISHLLELIFFGANTTKHPYLFLLLDGTLKQLQEDWNTHLPQLEITLSNRKEKNKDFHWNTTLYLYIFFVLRLLKILGLVGELQACPVCNRSFIDEKEIRSIWLPFEMNFHCNKCTIHNEQENMWDVDIVRLFSMGIHKKFLFFREFSVLYLDSLQIQGNGKQEDQESIKKEQIKQILSRMQNGMMDILHEFSNKQFQIREHWNNYCHENFK